MNSRIINAPRPDVLRMLERRMPREAREELKAHSFNAVGLVQASIPNLFHFADIAQKASNVFVTELTGNCPQHITTLAVFGETSAVRTALTAVEKGR
jgi:hypothetical protein